MLVSRCSRVSKMKHILSVIHYTICGAICFQFTHFSCDDWENIYTLFYFHHEIGSMNYYPLFRVRSWNNGVRCMSFYILFNESHTYIWGVSIWYQEITLGVPSCWKWLPHTMQYGLIDIKCMHLLNPCVVEERETSHDVTHISGCVHCKAISVFGLWKLSCIII